MCLRGSPLLNRNTYYVMNALRLFLLLSLAVAFTACDFFELRDRTLNTDPQVEFFPLSQTVDEGGDDGNSTVTVTPRIQLIAEQRDEALPVTYAVDDSSTAVEGTHFALSSTSASIPANASTTEISVEVLDNDLADDGTNYVLYLSLQNNEDAGVRAAPNLRTYVLTIRGQDE